MTSEATRWGASPIDWQILHYVTGVTEDLLPIVSNPKAKISERSEIQEVGKTPSIYNGGRYVAGFPSWTSFVASDADLRHWIREPDYGIGLQCRTVRAIDVDVSDATVAAEVEAFIRERLRRRLPRRGRANSPKFLLAFSMPGEYRKRQLKFGDGKLVEFLGNGQQFVMSGTHPSGVRYEWDESDVPAYFPPIAPADFETLWSALVQRFGNGQSFTETTSANARTEAAGKHALTADDLAELLVFVPGGERQHWLRILWALRSAWRESSIGLEEGVVLGLADAMSKRGDFGTYKDFEYVAARFRQGDKQENRGMTWKTLLWFARRGGWRPTIEQRERLQGDIADDFESKLSIGDIYGIE